MSVTIDDALIDKLCSLAKLDFQGEKREAIKHDLANMLQLLEKIQAVDTSDIEPLIHITTEINRYRDDTPQIVISKEEALANAPRRDSDYFRTPKFVEK